MIQLKSAIWYAETGELQRIAYSHLNEMIENGYKFAILNEYNKLIMFTKKPVNPREGKRDLKIVPISGISIKLIPQDYTSCKF